MRHLPHPLLTTITCIATLLCSSCDQPVKLDGLMSLSDEELLSKTSDIAFEQLSEAGDRMDRLSEPYKTIAIIYSAQGIIDNGGLGYFFENDWPENPPYTLFADAYERIGRKEAAQALRDAEKTFGIPNPEKNIQVRREYMTANYDQETSNVKGWNDCICGDEKVWSDLASWIRKKSWLGPPHN